MSPEGKVTASRSQRVAESHKRPRVDLTQACILDIPHHVRAHSAQITKSSERAKDTKAIKERWAGHGRCVCAEHKKRRGPPCHRQVPVGSIVQLCSTLAGTSQEEKGFIFHHLYTQASARARASRCSGEASATRIQWCIGDCKLCFTNFCYMLWTSPSTVREFVCIEAGPDAQRISKRHTGMPKKTASRGKQGEQVDFFFQEYYQSAGEPLPVCSQRVQQCSPGVEESSKEQDADILQNINGQWGPWLNKGDRLNNEDDDEYDPDRPVVSIAHMCTLACDGGVVGLPIRFIQHSTLWSLYWQFLSQWDALQMATTDLHTQKKSQGVKESAPSFATFQRRWHAIWRHYLRFRKSSTHAQCTTCFKLQRVMFERGSSVEERLDAARHLREHIRVTYLDRQIYWNLRFASRGFCDVLCIIIDSMDKTKFAWPRYGFAKRPHDLVNLCRPRVSFTIAIAHGYCVDMYAAPEELNHGSDAFVEVLCRTITHVREICQQRSIPFPRHLVVQSDNTVAQAKNQYAAVFLAVMVSRGLFLTANLMFLVVGHTHEDIDQLFGVVVSLILQLSSFETIPELMSYLLEKMRDHFHAKQEVVTQTCLSAVRDFARWCDPLNRTIWNCWSNRDGQEAPHAFTFKQGRDLSRSERAWLGESRGLDVSADVYCCVKTYMRDTSLQHEPVLVLPAGRHEQLVDEPREVCSRHAMGKQKIDNYTKLEIKLRDYGMRRAADALHALVHDRSYSLPPLPWLCHGWVVDRADRDDSGNFFSHTSQPPHGDCLLETRTDADARGSRRFTRHEGPPGQTRCGESESAYTVSSSCLVMSPEGWWRVL